MAEIADFGTIVLLVAAAFLLAVLSSKLTERIPLPAPALFLLAAAVVSDVFPRVGEELSIRDVERIAVVALILILFEGGMHIGWRRFRAAAGPVTTLGVLGTFAAAGVMALAARYLFGFDWTTAGIVGAALAPTDPAVMFSVLGNREVGGRRGRPCVRDRLRRRGLLGDLPGGLSLPWAAARLGVPMRTVELEPWDLAIRLRHEPRGVRRYVVAGESRAAGKAIGDLPLGDEAWIGLVLRRGEAVQARGSTVLEPGDEVLVLCEAERERGLRELFEGRHA